MNFFRSGIIILLLFIAASTEAQDTIITSKHTSIPVTNVSLHRTYVIYVLWNDTTAVVHKRDLMGLKKIKYATGEVVNLRTWQRQSALGLAIFTAPSTVHSELNYDSGISSNGLLLSYYYRGHLGGIVLSAGYAHTNLKIESEEHNIYMQPPYYTSVSSLESDNFLVMVTPRLNLGIGEAAPFFDLSLGLEFFPKTDSEIFVNEVSTLVEPGFGVQIHIFKKWLAELKAGAEMRNDFSDKPFFVPDIKFTLYRIFYSHITPVQN